MAYAEDLGAFAAGTQFGNLTPEVRQQTKIRILDALACALGALHADVVRRIRGYVTAYGPEGPCALIGGGGAAPDRAALFNGLLVRYLDFNDAYVAPGETCHPSDNFAPVLAAAEIVHADGATLQTALATAYQVQCRLSDEAPVRAHGFDHATQLAYSVAAGVSRALGLDATRTAHAIAMSGAALNALRVTRTGALSHWKGLAAPFAASCATEAALLAARGVTGPLEVFEGTDGLIETITGPFTIDWKNEGLDRIARTSLKRHNAEVHSQTAIQAALDLRDQYRLRASRIMRVDVEVFDVAYNIIGGGKEGSKTEVATKEEADHSLPYLIAVALLDGEVMPEQYAPARIARKDVQHLLRRVKVHPAPDLTNRFPGELPSRVTITLDDGQELRRELNDYPGYRPRASAWDDTRVKLVQLGRAHASSLLVDQILDAVAELDHITVAELSGLLREAWASRLTAVLRTL